MIDRPYHYLKELIVTANKSEVRESVDRHRFTQALLSTMRPVIVAGENLMLAEIKTFAEELISFI